MSPDFDAASFALHFCLVFNFWGFFANLYLFYLKMGVIIFSRDSDN